MEILGSIFILAVIGAVGLVMIRIVTLGQKHNLELKRLESEKSGGGSAQLAARCEALEKRCAALEEQLHATQMQLADEQRVLDKKLTHLLPENTSPKQ